MTRTHALVVDGVHVADIEVAATFGTRLRGLMLRRRLPEGLLLTPERSVHGLWVRRPLDVAALDSGGTVLRTFVLRPWALGPSTAGTRSVLEAPAGAFRRWRLTEGSCVEVAGA